MAYAVPVLRESEVHVLQEGEALRGGNIALIAAGTGLGEALLHNVDGRFVPSPSEGGHADFAARTEREIALLRDLTARYGRADVEHVVSGRGLVNIHRVAHAAAVRRRRRPRRSPDAPAAISAAALERRCAGCVETLDMFVEAYGAEAGNLALRTRVDRRPVRRRRHRAEDPAGADHRRLHARVPREAAARSDAGGDAGEGDPQRRGGAARRRGLRRRRRPADPRARDLRRHRCTASPSPIRSAASESADDPDNDRVGGRAERADPPRARHAAARSRWSRGCASCIECPRMSVPAVRGDRIFFTESDGARGPGGSLRAAEGSGLEADDAASIPNRLEADGTTAITAFEPDDTGDRVVYALSRHGSDVQELLVHDVASGAALGDRLQWVKFASIAWWGDGFFYTRYPQPGTVPPEQRTVFLPGLVPSPRRSAGRRSARLSPARRAGGRLRGRRDARRAAPRDHQPPRRERQRGGARHRPSAVDARGFSETDTTASGRWSPASPPAGTSSTARDGRLYFRTDAGAPFGRIVRFDLDDARSLAPHDGRAGVARHDRRRGGRRRTAARQLAAQRQQPPGDRGRSTAATSARSRCRASARSSASARAGPTRDRS